MIATIRATEHNDLPTLAKFLVFVYQFGPSDHHADPQLLEWTYLRASPLREGSRSSSKGMGRAWRIAVFAGNLLSSGRKHCKQCDHSFSSLRTSTCLLLPFTPLHDQSHDLAVAPHDLLERLKLWKQTTEFPGPSAQFARSASV